VLTAEELEVLALGFARDALDKQDAVLAELRARTGTLLAASSIVASFLGATAIGRDGLSLWSVAALIALAASLALCVVILLPRSDLSFSLDGPRVYEELYEFRGNPLEVHHRSHMTYGAGTRTTRRSSSDCSAGSDSHADRWHANLRCGRWRWR